jgi:flagellum-specific peptidoglycan hydrolase FlgJ
MPIFFYISVIKNPTMYNKNMYNKISIAREITEVPKEKTPVSQEEATTYIDSAFQRVFGGKPTPKQLAILVAQSAFETGWWKDMYNYNYGNIKGYGPSGLTTRLPTTEGYGKTKISIVDGFRAYADAFEGVDDYLELLRDKYPKASECMKKEDVDGFVRELQGHYFTGSPSAYKSAVNKIVKQLVPQITSASNEKTKSSKNKKKAYDVLSLADKFEKLAKL